MPRGPLRTERSWLRFATRAADVKIVRRRFDSMVAVAEGSDDGEAYLVLAFAGLIVVGGLYLLLRAARGR